MNEEEDGDRPVEAMETSQQSFLSSTQTQGDDRSSENDDSSSDDSSDEQTPWPVTVGGTIESDAFALLDGVVYHDMNDTSEFERVSIPLTRLPATLGRTHTTEDQNFFGLGKRKSVSREQCRIFYQDAHGGRLIQKGAGDDFTYQAPPKRKISVMTLQNSKKLPPKGFFAIECVGKNRIFVGKKPVEQGEVAQLESGTPIRISTYCLYFLLPTDVTSQKTLAVPNPSFRKRPATPKAAAAGQPKPKRQVGGMNATQALIAELESMSVEELLQESHDAFDAKKWERRHQLMGGLITLDAVKAAARSKTIRQRAANDENWGVSRSDIIDWIGDSPKYKRWVKILLEKVEFRSYQTMISKALLKAGFNRIGMQGCHVKWQLPEENEDSDNHEEAGDEKVEAKAAENEEKSVKASEKDQCYGMNATEALIAELESMSVDELLQESHDAFDAKKWERRHQMMGGLITFHAVKAAARSKIIRQRAMNDENWGVSRYDIIDWIADSPQFKRWVNIILEKVEFRTYQIMISKALLKAGFNRIGMNGCHVKWQLPEGNEDSDNDEKVEEKAAENEEKSVEASEKDSNEESGDEEDDNGGVNRVGDNDDSEEGEEADKKLEAQPPSKPVGHALAPVGQNDEEEDDDDSNDSMEVDESPDRANQGEEHQDGGEDDDSENSEDDSSVNRDGQVTPSPAQKENDDGSDDSGSDLMAQS